MEPSVPRQAATHAAAGDALSALDLDRLRRMVDALRASMDVAEYKNVVGGLVLLRLLSRGFEERDANLTTARAEGADPEGQGQCDFWMPPEVRWAHLKAQADQPTIGQVVDEAMSWLGRPRATVDTTRLGQLIDLVSNLDAGDLLPEFHTPVPPTDVHDASGWDRYWDEEIASGGAPDLTPGFAPPPGLLSLMLRRGLRTVLCAGNGLSIEPLVLAGTGFVVTALDLSTRATDFWRTRLGNAPRHARRCALTWLVGSLRAERLHRELNRQLHSEARRARFRFRMRLACRMLFGWPRGHADFVRGTILDAAVCTGPFDVVIEHNLLNLFAEPERAVALECLVARLAPRGVFASATHYADRDELHSQTAFMGTWLGDRGFALAGPPDGDAIADGWVLYDPLAPSDIGKKGQDAKRFAIVFPWTG